MTRKKSPLTGKQAKAPTDAGVKPTKKKELTSKAGPDAIYQLKVTLIGTDPPIWRRIQVADCTLDTLHKYIQGAMGWDNSHLHEFRIGRQRYGDPEFLDRGFGAFGLGDFGCEDSTDTKISEILANARKRFRFKYEYDFGDSWEHEIMFEGCQEREPRAKYPVCLEGERACPPDDIGGIHGYYNYLEALADPKHDRHDEFLEWAGKFDPEKFDAKRATKEMR